MTRSISDGVVPFIGVELLRGVVPFIGVELRGASNRHTTLALCLRSLGLPGGTWGRVRHHCGQGRLISSLLRHDVDRRGTGLDT